MILIPSCVTLPKVVKVTTEPTVCAIAIDEAHFDDVTNETTVTMLIRPLTLIQNLPPASKDIGNESQFSRNCWLSL